LILNLKKMKIKTINKILIKKFNSFLDSITDKEVKNLLQKNSLISGGCIASMLQQEKVNDYDIYLTNKETCLAVANYYANKMKETDSDLDIHVIDTDTYSTLNEGTRKYYEDRGFTQPGRIGIFCKDQSYETETTEEEIIDMMEEVKEQQATQEDKAPKYRVQYVSPNAISLSHNVQIILRFYGTPEEIHSNYDFVHCTNYWLSMGQKLILNQKALESIITKELQYVGSKYPIASMIRIRKFIQRGWTCNAGVHLKIAFQISKINMEDVSVLEDQLVGVDVGYFIAFINSMKSAQIAHKDDEKPFVITYSYICELIDRIFND
jgi:hypothetical protein